MASLAMTAALTAGCAKFYTDQADKEVYGIVSTKNQKEFAKASTFTIQPQPGVEEFLKSREGTVVPAKPTETAPYEKPPPADGPPAAQPLMPGQAVPEPVVNLPPALPEPSPKAIGLTVADALRVAVRTSRSYQTQKETVYLTALTLTFQRYLFDPHPTWTGNTIYVNNDLGQPDLRRSRSWDLTSDVGVSQTLAQGALITGNLGLAALKFLNKELGDTVDQAMLVTVNQPLWRGAGQAVVQENLIQAERNALYAVRTFARFEQQFAVSIASEYMRVLQSRDTVINDWENYRSLVMNRERAEWLAKAERLPEFQVDQARQDELRAYNRWIVDQEAYANAVDAFKITLGIPVTTEIVLDPKEFDRLAAGGLRHPEVKLDDATKEALTTRLDLKNSRDAVDDADRKIKVAENGLAGDVDLVASIGYKSQPGPPQSAQLRFNRGNYSVGLNISMPIDRLQERNALRQTQISRQAAGRNYDETQDDVIFQVRQSMRQLDQARESYETQKRSVALAERRVESTQLLLQAGRAEQRDVLDSQQALVDARNALTNALVDHSIAVLQFQRDVGTLVVDEEGQIHGWVLTDGKP
ncbi:MAG: TolC family protein [Planctomycetota bacterium]|nr:TolC family protein [Planctomycetota bacterium]